jgi:hypothetical protein
MSLVERWFAEITNKWLRHGTHRSVKELADSITHWVGTWNDEPRPYVCHETADEIFDSLAFYVNESPTQDTRTQGPQWDKDISVMNFGFHTMTNDQRGTASLN